MMKIQLISNGYYTQAQLLKKKILAKINADFGDEGLIIELRVDESVGGRESFRIDAIDGGFAAIGSDVLGLSFAIGKLLHTAKWSEDSFAPRAMKNTVTPACDIREVYVSSHFYNWFQMASMDELEEYIGDLLLWGYNCVNTSVFVVMFDDVNDPGCADQVQRARGVFQIAKKYGMYTSTGFASNQGCANAPKEYLADVDDMNMEYRGTLGTNLCPSKPEALEYLKEQWRFGLEIFKDIGIDYLRSWPYDEGGCLCKKCRPWGAVGYGNMIIEAHKVAKEIFPNAKIVVSTWTFDTPVDEGEYEGLYRRLEGDLSFVDYLLVDSHGAYPRYVLEHKPVKPIINFPEISMWGLSPWGGFGANPLPERFQRIWDSCKHILSGGEPYSEGIYEDISKIQCVGYYIEPDRHWTDTLAEYINYEYGDEFTEELLELMRLIEVNHTHIAENEEPEYDLVDKAFAIALSVNDRMSEKKKIAWRWRILYIRAVLDKKRYSKLATDTLDDPKRLRRFIYYSADLLTRDEEAQAMFHELRRIYHCADYNCHNHYTLPPVGKTISDAVI